MCCCVWRCDAHAQLELQEVEEEDVIPDIRIYLYKAEMVSIRSTKKEHIMGQAFMKAWVMPQGLLHHQLPPSFLISLLVLATVSEKVAI
eukprot:1155976-Pelagomonas_calceolata.AAC.1